MVGSTARRNSVPTGSGPVRAGVGWNDRKRIFHARHDAELYEFLSLMVGRPFGRGSGRWDGRNDWQY